MPAVANIAGVCCLEMMAIVLDIDTGLSKFNGHFVLQYIVEPADQDALVATDAAVNGDDERAG